MSEVGSTPVSLRDRLMIALWCGVAWLPIAFVRGGYSWDDWVVGTATREESRHHLRQLGRLFPHYSEVFQLAGSPAVRLLTVFALVSTGLAVAAVVGRFGVLGRNEIVLVAVLTAVNPLDTSKSLLSTATYSWSLAFFFIGWFALTRRRWWVLAFPLFFVSYDTSSLLFFSVLPLIDLMFFDRSWRDAVVRLKIAGLSVTVVVYAVIRFFLRTPEGSYDGYNAVGVVGLAFMLACLGAVALLALGLLRGRSLVEEVGSGGHLLSAIGVLLIFVGLIPYLVDRQLPPYLGPSTRHYLLVGLGLGVTVVGVSRSLSATGRIRWRQASTLRLVASLAVMFAWLNGFLSLQHWRFVDAVSQEVSSVDIPVASLVVVTYEHTPDVVISQRLGPNYADHWYVWTNIVDRAGDQAIFAIHGDWLADYLEGRLARAYDEQRDSWGVDGYEPTTTATQLEIESTGGVLGFFASYEVSVSEIDVDVPRG